MERGEAASMPEPMRRYWAVDDAGGGLRATWRPAQGFTNLSLWRGTVCVETFRLSAEQMGELIAFLGASLAAACPPPPRLRVVPSPEQSVPAHRPLGEAVRRGRDATARLLDAAATRVRSTARG
jgi:hypothetical protein